MTKSDEKISWPRARSLGQEQDLLAKSKKRIAPQVKSKFSLPRAMFLCQEQYLFAKSNNSLPRAISLCQEQYLLAKSKISWPRAKSLGQEQEENSSSGQQQSFFSKRNISLPRAISLGQEQDLVEICQYRIYLRGLLHPSCLKVGVGWGGWPSPGPLALTFGDLRLCCSGLGHETRAC